MKKGKLLILLSIVSLVLAAIPLTASCTQPTPTPDKPIVLKAVIMAPVPQIKRPLEMFIGKVAERSGGQLTIEVLGGSEVIPAFDQPQAISEGVVDMGVCPFSYVSALEPAAEAQSCVMWDSPMKQREKGVNDLWNEIIKEVNLFYLGITDCPQDRYLWTTVPVRKVEDIKGLKFRVAPGDMISTKAMGAEPISIPRGEVYGALEQGVVDGYYMSSPSHASGKLYEVCKYAVDHNISVGGNLVVLVNLDVFNGLPKDLQKLMIDAMIETEKEWVPMMEKTIADARAEILAGGTEFITFPPEEASRYLDLRYEPIWQLIFEKAPEWAPRLREVAGEWK